MQTKGVRAKKRLISRLARGMSDKIAQNYKKCQEK